MTGLLSIRINLERQISSVNIFAAYKNIIGDSDKNNIVAVVDGFDLISAVGQDIQTVVVPISRSSHHGWNHTGSETVEISAAMGKAAGHLVDKESLHEHFDNHNEESLSR